MSDFALTLLLGWFRATRIRCRGVGLSWIVASGERRRLPAIAGSSAAESAATMSAVTGAHRPGQLARVASRCGDIMVTGGDGLLQKFPADPAGGRDDRESRVSLHYLTSERLV